MRRADHVFNIAVGLYVLGLGLSGFAQSFYLRGWMAPYPLAPGLTPLIKLHAFLFTAWMLLAVLQPALIAASAFNLHRRLGPFAFVLAALMIVTALYTGAVAMTVGFREVSNPDLKLRFFAVPVFAMVGFASMLLLAWRTRRAGETHKRLILLAHVSLLEAPAVRMFRIVDAPAFPTLLLLIYLPVIGGIAYDLATRRRVHPAYLLGGAALVGLGMLRNEVMGTDAWLAIAKGARDLV